MDIITYRC